MTEEFIRKAQAVHGDTYDYAQANYVNVKQKVVIVCRSHGAFAQRADCHLRGVGCPRCYFDSNRSTTTKFIARAQQLHLDRYDYSQVEYVGVKHKVTIVCRQHGPFEQIPNDHLSGRGCPLCSRKRRLTTAEFIERANNIHDTTYDYTQTNYIGGNNKVTICCKIHGPFKQRADNHLRCGAGCPVCSGNQLSNTEYFVTKAQLVHGDTYDYSHVHYVKSHLKVTIICREHGPFEQKPNGHLSGLGCAKCGGTQLSNTESFIGKARVVHGDTYDYSRVRYQKASTKVTIICCEHGAFDQTPGNHLSGVGCPQCVVRGYSRKALNWLTQIAKEQNINIQHAENGGEFKIPGTRWKADGYCKETNTIYEFHGDAWHGNPLVYESATKCHPFNRRVTAHQLYSSTVLREEKIRSLGYGLVVTWESTITS